MDALRRSSRGPPRLEEDEPREEPPDGEEEEAAAASCEGGPISGARSWGGAPPVGERGEKREREVVWLWGLGEWRRRRQRAS